LDHFSQLKVTLEEVEQFKGSMDAISN